MHYKPLRETVRFGANVQSWIPLKAPKFPALANRVCSEPGCDTILSQYNSKPQCWKHQGK